MRALFLVRAGVSALAMGGLVALAWGPAQYLRDDRTAAPSIRTVVLGSAPDAPSALTAWPTGVVDTAELVPGRAAAGIEPTALPVTAAEAAAAAGRPDTITVVGTPSADAVTGVGAVVTEADVDLLAALPEPRRTADVRFLVDPSGAALSVVGVDGAPDRGATLVDAASDRTTRTALDGHGEVADLLRVWAQVRPEITALVPSASGGPAASILAATGVDPGLATPVLTPGTRPWRTVVARTVTRELLPALAHGRAPVSPALLAQRSPAGLVTIADGSARLTARGAAYAVAARVVQPGSRAMAVRAPDDLVAQAYARPGGGASLLVWNPGAARTLVLQFPAGDHALRLELPVGAGALTGVVLAPR
ncbi:hypothetical protein GCM10022215_26350 [Nocardioides fonticola]|uniref:Uncharacterized protein n=1 Tax=Nocardioides fonticola TaxID=450363 RepID=A0ABP7XLY7_9ACTN